MTTPNEIKAALITALGDRLGTYTFSTGDVTPSIVVDNGADPLPENPSRMGLEVVIQPLPMNTLKHLGGNDFQKTVTTIIHLKQFDIMTSVLPFIDPVVDAISSFSSLLIDPTIRHMERMEPIDNVETAEIRVVETLFVRGRG